MILKEIFIHNQTGRTLQELIRMHIFNWYKFKYLDNNLDKTDFRIWGGIE